VAQRILMVHTPCGTDELAEALVLRAVEDPASTPLAAANLLVLLVERLPHGHRRQSHVASTDLVAAVVQECHRSLQDVETERPPACAHGAVLFLGELFKRQFVGTGEVKALFAALVFGDARPLDHAAALSCHLFLTCGPFLERNALGRKLADLTCARLKELKGHNFSEATLFSLAHVTDLKLNKWVHKERKERPKEKKPKVVEAPPAPRPPVADPRPATRYDKILQIGKLFVQKKVPTAQLQALFAQLLAAAFKGDTAPVEEAVGLLRQVGPTLDGSEAGAQVVEGILARLGELRATPEVDAMVSDVAKLRARAWSPALRTYCFAC
jgi:hypothetical protein